MSDPRVAAHELATRAGSSAGSLCNAQPSEFPAYLVGQRFGVDATRDDQRSDTQIVAFEDRQSDVVRLDRAWTGRHHDRSHALQGLARIRGVGGGLSSAPETLRSHRLLAGRHLCRDLCRGHRLTVALSASPSGSSSCRTRSEHELELEQRAAGEAVSCEQRLHVRGPKAQFQDEVAALDEIVAEDPGLTEDSHRKLLPASGRAGTTRTRPRTLTSGLAVSDPRCTG